MRIKKLFFVYLFGVFSILTNPAVEITLFYIIVRNLRTFVPFSKEPNISYRKGWCYDKDTHIYK